MSPLKSSPLFAALAVLLLFVAAPAFARTFERCELARELRDNQGVPSDQLATWVCIANFESNFDTAAIGRQNADDSADHGIFQINDRYWCSPPGTGCGIPCTDLQDDDISDDVTCAQHVYSEHQTQTGNGFTAWTVYEPHCSGGSADQFLDGCF